MSAYSNQEDYLDVASLYAFGATDLWDNGYWIEQSGFNQHSSMARAVFVTRAEGVSIDVYCNGEPDESTAIQVRINGALWDSPIVPEAGANTITLELPEGLKQVEIVAGVQAIPVEEPLGVFLVGCEFQTSAVRVPPGGVAETRGFRVGPTRQLPPASANRLVIYGDSIAQGGAGSPNIATAWPGRLRSMTSRSVTIEAMSGRSLYDDINTSGLRSAFVAMLAAMEPVTIWIAIGTNDYQLRPQQCLLPLPACRPLPAAR